MRLSTFFFAFLYLVFVTSCGNDAKAPAANQTSKLNVPVGLTLMTFRFLEQDRAFIKQFEDRYRIRINVIVKPMREIVAAAQNGQTPEADVLFVPTIEDAVRLKGFDVLQPFFVDAFTKGQVGDRYLDDEGFYAGLTKWTMAAVYNPNAVTATEASTYLGIAKAAGRGVRIGAAHPDSSGLAGLVGSLSTHLNPEAATLWANTVYHKTVGGLQGSDQDQMNRMLAGDLDMAFISSGAATRWILDGNPTHYDAGRVWQIALPKTGATDVNFYNMTCVTMPANTPNRGMAIAFINMLFGEETQQVLTDSWFEFPTYAFGRVNQYLSNYEGTIGTRFTAEQVEQATPAGWALINQAAEQQ